MPEKYSFFRELGAHLAKCPGERPPPFLPPQGGLAQAAEAPPSPPASSTPRGKGGEGSADHHGVLDSAKKVCPTNRELGQEPGDEPAGQWALLIRLVYGMSAFIKKKKIQLKRFLKEAKTTVDTYSNEG